MRRRPNCSERDSATNCGVFRKTGAIILAASAIRSSDMRSDMLIGRFLLSSRPLFSGSVHRSQSSVVFACAAFATADGLPTDQYRALSHGEKERKPSISDKINVLS